LLYIERYFDIKAQNMHSQVQNEHLIIKKWFESCTLFFCLLFKITHQLLLAICDHGVVGLNSSNLWPKNRSLNIPIDLFVSSLTAFWARGEIGWTGHPPFPLSLRLLVLTVRISIGRQFLRTVWRFYRTVHLRMIENVEFKRLLSNTSRIINRLCLTLGSHKASRFLQSYMKFIAQT
jgi:hypothetical protein